MTALKKYGIQRVNMLTCQHAGRVNILAISDPYMCHKSSCSAKNCYFSMRFSGNDSRYHEVSFPKNFFFFQIQFWCRNMPQKSALPLISPNLPNLP